VRYGDQLITAREVVFGVGIGSITSCDNSGLSDTRVPRVVGGFVKNAGTQIPRRGLPRTSTSAHRAQQVGRVLLETAEHASRVAAEVNAYLRFWRQRSNVERSRHHQHGRRGALATTNAAMHSQCCPAVETRLKAKDFRLL
jgi:hypothetical protein